MEEEDDWQPLDKEDEGGEIVEDKDAGEASVQQWRDWVAFYGRLHHCVFFDYKVGGAYNFEEVGIVDEDFDCWEPQWQYFDEGDFDEQQGRDFEEEDFDERQGRDWKMDLYL